MVFSEETVDLRADDRQTKELRRIADRVRKIAVRDFQDPIAVLIVADQGSEPVVRIGVAIEEEVIVEDEDRSRFKTEKFDPDRIVTDEEAAATLASAEE